MPTLLIADDHPLFRAALRSAALEAAPDTVACEADSFEGVIRQLEARPEIDLVLLDLHMPGNHGLAGLAAIRAQFPAVAVVLVSANEDPQVIRRALDHGAAGSPVPTAGRPRWPATPGTAAGRVGHEATACAAAAGARQIGRAHV